MKRSLTLFCAALLLAGVTHGLIAAEPTSGTFTSSDGLKIHYLEMGTGTPVVLIHGYTGSAEGNWFANGIAEELARHHRVVAIDCRGHGESDKPHDPTKYGPRMAQDVIELMDHLHIEKAHLHGYSMGGIILAQLLASNPERFLTAAFGGSGITEEDPDWRAKVPPDTAKSDPAETEARQKLAASPMRDEEALRAVRSYPWEPSQRPRLDLTKITIPVLAINGEFDRPNAKTHRMQRELSNFKSVVLPGKSHLTAIMAGYIPKEYIAELKKFIDENDPKS